MSGFEIEDVLRNWINEATTSSGQLAQGIDPAKWVADNFAGWWRKQVEESLSDAESAARRLGVELDRLKSPARLDGAFHELRHIVDALCDLRRNLGLPIK